MLPVPGHLASALILSKLFNFNLPFTLFVTYFPDLFDKVAWYLFKGLETGRAYLHSLMGLSIISVLIWVGFGRNLAFAWAVVHFAHLICDSYLIPWFYPFRPIPDIENLVFVVSAFSILFELIFFGSSLLIYYEMHNFFYNQTLNYAIAFSSLLLYIIYNQFLFKRFYVKMTPEQRKEKRFNITY